MEKADGQNGIWTTESFGPYDDTLNPTSTGNYGNCPGPIHDNYDYMQTTRFNDSAHLVDYVCENSRYFRWTTYVPICQFPWINAGWGNDNQTGFGDVKFNDCSITYAQAVGSKYNTKCMIYGLTSLFPFVTMVWFLHVINQQRDKKKRRTGKCSVFTTKPNLSEKV